jgi:cbb3-type cytochrome oxidase maturation protein
MSILGLLIAVSVLLGAAGLAAFFWALRSGQYDDLDGGAHRILEDEDGPRAPPTGRRRS